MDGALYRGGFLALALLSAVLIVSVLTAAGPVPALLATRPLVWIGLISYGLYLFHWPHLPVARRGADRPGLWPLFALRLAVTFTIAIASYRFLEMPVRRRAFHFPRRRTVAIAAATVVLIVTGVAFASTRDVETNLAGIDEAVGAAPEVEADRTLDILVIAGGRGAPLAKMLTAADARADDVSVTEAAPFSCAGVRGAGPGDVHQLDRRMVHARRRRRSRRRRVRGR